VAADADQYADRDPAVTGAAGEARAHFVDARVGPRGSLENLSQQEMAQLLDRGQGGLYPLFRRCALAVLNAGSHSDDPTELFARFRDFDIRMVRESWGVKLELKNAPAVAFVDGEMIRGVKEHLFAVLRDIVYIANEIVDGGRFDLSTPAGISNAVFHILRNAGILNTHGRPGLIVCWGGHSISRSEYDYTKLVGYELGLRGLNVCTGCGPGAMKGPMKGATIGHSKQRIPHGRYVGLTEPGIVAAEPPNPIVSHLVIMPDIEKRLEAFARLAHGFIIFPGGVGTAEEILYLLGVLLEPANAERPLPVVLTGPAASAPWFQRVHEFVGVTLGAAAQARYRIILGDPAAAARAMVAGLDDVRRHRKLTGDSYNFSWTLQIPREFQLPFEVSHASVASLDLHLDQPLHARAANLRRVFSAIVTGNVKEQGIRMIDEHGPFEIHGEARLLEPLDALLGSFIEQRRMKISGPYRPVYRVVA
jgi:pyrimidine/purine-5'-nucleotide nucleosidase